MRLRTRIRLWLKGWVQTLPERLLAEAEARALEAAERSARRALDRARNRIAKSERDP